jgi:hypothetical protein
VLLYIHGGPGYVSIPMSWWFTHGLEEYFTVVQWDQRATGKTYLLTDPAKIAPTLTRGNACLPTRRKWPPGRATSSARTRLALFAFRSFLNAALDTIGADHGAKNSDLAMLPEWALCVLGNSLFLWSSLGLVTVSLIGPDLLVTAVMYLDAGLLLRLRRQAGVAKCVAFGFALGAGYWVKAIIFSIAPRLSGGCRRWSGQLFLVGTLCAAQNYPNYRLHYVVRRGRILAHD